MAEPTQRSILIGSIYEASKHLIDGFDVHWITDEPTGLMLHCRWCGVHDWRPTETRTLADLFESALGHRQDCTGLPGEPTEDELAEARAWRHANFPGIRDD